MALRKIAISIFLILAFALQGWEIGAYVFKKKGGILNVLMPYYLKK